MARGLEAYFPCWTHQTNHSPSALCVSRNRAIRLLMHTLIRNFNSIPQHPPIVPQVLEVYLGASGRHCEMLESGYTNICH